MTGEGAGPPHGYMPAAPAGHFESTTGPFYIRHAPDGAAHAFIVTQAHMNMSGAAHGGMLGSFAHRVLRQAAIAANQGEMVALLSISLSFLAAAREGDLVECLPRVIRGSAANLLVEAKFTAGGVVILTASSLWESLRTRPKTAKKAEIQG